ncbi:S-(hydroxymethyl)glutathione synthase [Planococcus versutus]|uniref:S-(hydroxymethyl)glutathione synthase n=1 Tax=Planococcus versutus TaxID=1302659 RepID=A0A1B1S1S7_9BACL|nr:S-(hydroxymethyl)glutathione synthase [Planococcus versutus]ANU27114.1 S-(hydroxymethyl)glutathione synthase [Planococcus versutus]
MITNLHPKLTNGLNDYPEVNDFSGGTLQCLCESNKVEVKIDAQTLHNHACGCSKCWKPEGATFSLVAVVPSEKVQVIHNEDKLAIVDETAAIQRHFCKECNAHMFGRIENKDHAFYGLDFVHTELSADKGWSAPQFAAFVSSIIETGTPTSEMGDIRKTLNDLGLPTYDVLSPELMDVISAKAAELNGTLKK